MEDNNSNIEEQKNPIVLLMLKFKKAIIIILIAVVVIIGLLITRAIYISNLPEFEVINGTTQEVKEDTGKPISTYFTFLPNSLYDYKQTDGSSRNKTVFVSYFNQSRVEYAIYSPAIANYWFNEIYEMSNGEIRRVLYAPNSDLYMDLTDKSFDQETTIILKEPIVLGNMWKIGSGEAEATITKVDAEIKTANGLYKTVEVTTDFKNGNYRKDYFSESSGIVKSIEINSDGTSNELVLEKIEPLSGGLDRAIYVYYLQKGTFNSIRTLIDFKAPTNKASTDIFREILSTPNDPYLLPLISPYTKINKIELDKDNRYIHVDFTKDFYDYTSSDKKVEVRHLQALADTFCRYYQVLNLKLTIDGEPYTSANYQLGPDDTIKANFK